MKQFDVFTSRDIRNRSVELLKDAWDGQVSLITKQRKPAIGVIPFDERLLNHGVSRVMGLHLFESHQLTLVKSAKLAGLSVEEII